MNTEARRAYMQTYQREWLRRRKEAWFKEHGPCVKCGSWERLELDHIDPDKKVSSRIWSWAEVRRVEELKKCQVLCHDCHKLKTRIQSRKEKCPKGHPLVGDNVKNLTTRRSRSCKTCNREWMRNYRKKIK